MENITKQVEKHLKTEGRKKGWLKDLLRMTYPTMKDRFNRHNWTQEEIFILKQKNIITNG